MIDILIKKTIDQQHLLFAAFEKYRSWCSLCILCKCTSCMHFYGINWEITFKLHIAHLNHILIIVILVHENAIVNITAQQWKIITACLIQSMTTIKIKWLSVTVHRALYMDTQYNSMRYQNVLFYNETVFM